MQNLYKKDRDQIISNDANYLKWKLYIHNKLALNCECFVEIPIDTTTHYTIVDANEVCDFAKGNFKNIRKNELIFLLKEVRKDYICNNYFITTRSMYDSHNYYIVLTLIH
jgi:hypothetical protein